MKSIRCGRGLGDSIYLQSVVRHLLNRGAAPLKVCSDFPDVFRPLGNAASVVPFTRQGVNIVAHYVQRKPVTNTTQWQDCCLQAGITEPAALHLDWRLTDHDLPRELHQHARPIVCVQLPRAPMGRTDGFGAELLPDCTLIQRAIDTLRGRALIVQIGAGEAWHRFTGIDVDLANRTSVAQLLDVASIAQAFIGYVSFLVPLAESFDRPALFVWSRRGLRSPRAFIHQITPAKVLHKRETSRFVIDDAPPEMVERAAEGLLP